MENIDIDNFRTIYYNTLEMLLNRKYNIEKHIKIEKIVIMKEDWNVDNGLTTPTMKVKRNAIEK